MLDLRFSKCENAFFSWFSKKNRVLGWVESWKKR